MLIRRQEISRNGVRTGSPAGASPGVRRVGATCLLAGSALLSPAVPALTQQADNSEPTPAADSSVQLEEVEVTAQRRDLLGTASTASEGVVGNQEIQLTPVYRPGQIL